MAGVNAVDTMNRPFYAKAELAKPLFDTYEFQVLAETTFGGIKYNNNIPDGEEWRVFEVLGHSSVANVVEEMEDANVEYTFMDQSMQWSRRHNRLLKLADIEDLAEMADESDGRIVPGVGYNPNRIQESLDRVERAVEDLDFQYVWFHPMTFGLRPTDQKCYPLYSKAIELDVPVCLQTGHSAEPLPSEHGHPMYADEVAMDFPDLDLVLTHAGWPWWREWCSMLWRHPNVYGNIGAYMPSFLPDEQWAFIDTGRIRHKVLWGTNGLGLTRCKEEILDLPIEEKTKKAVLRDNAIDLFDL